MTPLDKQTLFLLYDAPDNTAQVQVVVRDETIGMAQKALATLFMKRRHITFQKHIL